MTTYDITYLISQFKKIFPEIDKGDILYKSSEKRPNTLQIIFKGEFMQKHNLIFVYYDMDCYKLMTVKQYRNEEKALEKMRSELSRIQMTLKNERRQKSK